MEVTEFKGNYVSIPGIMEIFLIPKSNIPSTMLFRHLSGIDVGYVGKMIRVNFVGQPLATLKIAWLNGSIQQTAELKFRHTKFISSLKGFAVAFSTVSGQSYIIGERNGKGPIFEASYSSGTTSESHIVEYTVRYTGRVALFPVAL